MSLFEKGSGITCRRCRKTDIDIHITTEFRPGDCWCLICYVDSVVTRKIKEHTKTCHSGKNRKTAIMSYDISLMTDLGKGLVDTGAIHWNYTSNCSRMWKGAGIPMTEFHGRKAADCLDELLEGITELEQNQEKYEAMNPENGWGAYETLLPALRRLYEAFEEAPLAIVNVWH